MTCGHYSRIPGRALTPEFRVKALRRRNCVAGTQGGRRCACLPYNSLTVSRGAIAAWDAGTREAAMSTTGSPARPESGRTQTWTGHQACAPPPQVAGPSRGSVARWNRKFALGALTSVRYRSGTASADGSWHVRKRGRSVLGRYEWRIHAPVPSSNRMQEGSKYGVFRRTDGGTGRFHPGWRRPTIALGRSRAKRRRRKPFSPDYPAQ